MRGGSRFVLSPFTSYRFGFPWFLFHLFPFFVIHSLCLLCFVYLLPFLGLVSSKQVFVIAEWNCSKEMSKLIRRLGCERASEIVLRMIECLLSRGRDVYVNEWYCSGVH